MSSGDRFRLGDVVEVPIVMNPIVKLSSGADPCRWSVFGGM